MGNKYINKLRNKLLNMSLNEGWAQDYLYGKQQPAMHGSSNYGEEMVGREIKKNPDGSSAVVTNFADGTSKTEVARDNNELRRLLGL